MLRAIRWVQDNIANFGGDPYRLFLAGHSAGAYNAVMLALDHSFFRDNGVTVSVKAVAALSGPYDFYPFEYDEVRNAFGAAANPEGTQPVNLVTSDDPPVFLASGTHDPIVRIQNTQHLAQKLRDAGDWVTEKYYDGFGHMEPVLALGAMWRWRAPVLDDIVSFFQRFGAFPSEVPRVAVTPAPPEGVEADKLQDVISQLDTLMSPIGGASERVAAANVCGAGRIDGGRPAGLASGACRSAPTHPHFRSVRPLEASASCFTPVSAKPASRSRASASAACRSASPVAARINGRWARRRAGPSSGAPSRRASISSTPPMSIPSAPARRSPARCSRSLAPRSEVVIATKVHGVMRPGPNGRGLSRKAILNEIDASLQRLGTDYVDLYQIHRWDPVTPIEETLEALKRCGAGRQGPLYRRLPRCMRGSSCRRWRSRTGTAGPGSCPCRTISTCFTARKSARCCRCARPKGSASSPWSPLARGRLTRPWGTETNRTETDAFGKTLYAKDEASDRAIVEAVIKVAASRGVAAAEVALAWVLQKQPVTAPIVGVTKLPQLEDAIKAVEVTLTAEEIATLEAPYTPRAIAGFN